MRVAYQGRRAKMVRGLTENMGAVSGGVDACGGDVVWFGDETF